MPEMITQCPKCSTTFHVTEELLASAKGSVRCGSCMAVFNGREYLIQDDNFDELEDPKQELDNTDKHQSPSKDVKHNTFNDDTIDAYNKPDIHNKPDEDSEDDEIEEVTEDESWALDLLEEEGHDASQMGLVKKQQKDSASNNKPSQEKTNTSGASAQNKLLDLIEPETVEIAYKAKKRFWKSKIGLSLLIVIGAAALGSQIAWLKYNELNKIEPYRTYYGKICAITGCVLPDLIDKTKIKTSNLIVRSHPKKDNALLVEVLVQNNALFEQPFPRLTLQFKNLKNIVVARRTFKPEDYLAGEVANLKLMPTKQPIRIKMELVDPGEGAVSYDMNIGP